MLHRNRNTEIGTQRIVAADTHVGERPATRNELPAYFLVSEIELQTIARTEPVIGPSLGTLATATDPTTDYVAAVGVAVAPRAVLVERTWILSVGAGSTWHIR